MRARGFTLIEMIIVIVVLGAIFAVGGLVLGRAFESYSLTAATTDVDWQGRVAMERMVRELREVRSATAGDLDMTSASQIWFIDRAGAGVCFYRDATTSRLMRSSAAAPASCTSASPQPLADNIAPGGLNFYYYRNNGNVAVSAPQVYYISVTLNVVDGQVNETYRASVKPGGF